MRNDNKPALKYSHQLYEKDIPTYAELSKLAECGSLADVLKFKKDKASQLENEETKLSNKKSNFIRDEEAGRLKPDYVKRTGKKKASNQAIELSTILGFRSNNVPLAKNSNQITARQPQLSRKLADPFINDPVLNSIRVQSWYLTLLANWFPSEAMKFRDHMMFNLIASEDGGRDLDGIESLRSMLPDLPPDGNGGEMLEKKLREALRHNPRLKSKRYNLKARNYVFGTSTPSEETISEFGLVCQDSETVYRLGFDGLPMWQVLDGDLETCQAVAAKFLTQDLVESPNQYAQFVLNVLHGRPATDLSQELVCPFDSGADQVLVFLEQIFAKLNELDLVDLGSNDLTDKGNAVANGTMLLVSLVRINPMFFVESSARLRLLLIMLHKHQLIRHVFGLLVEFYISKYMLYPVSVDHFLVRTTR